MVSFRQLGSVSLVMALFLFGGELRADTAKAPPSPTPWLKAQVERAKTLAERKFEPNSKEEEAWKAEIKSIVDEVIDWGTLTEKSMGIRWSSLSASQQKEFATLLRELAESSYQSKLQLAARSSDREKTAKETGSKLKLEWGDEVVSGNTASAKAMVKSGKTKVQLGFELEWKDGRWKVWDVVIDEASTVRTYRTSFTKIMKGDSGYEGLIRRMKERIEKIRSGEGDLVNAQTFGE